MILILSLIGVYILILLGIAWFSLHPPRTPVFISPGALGVPQEEVEFQSSDGIILRGWWVEKPGSRCTVVLGHGYLMNRSELSPLAATLWQAGCSCLVYDFRAHGRSGGRKSGFGYLERFDVRGAVEFAKARKPGSSVVLVGSSMGSAASAFALADDPGLADGLILDSCYSRFPSAILGWWRFLGGPILSALLSPTVVIAAPLAGFNPFRVDVADALKRVKAPVLILHGDCDNLALPDEARRNAEACGCEVVWLEKCGHSEGRWIHAEEYEAAAVEFLRRWKGG